MTMEAPGHTDLMVAPETLDDYLADNPPPPKIDNLRKVPGLVYVGTPYTNYPRGRWAAAHDAALYTARLLEHGVRAVSPIAHSHAVAMVGGLDPVDHALWQWADEPLVEAAGALAVIKLPGWQESRGLTYEIAEFTRAGKPVVYIAPGEV